jgi:glycosyltransferase involved in cell wall biosynthesis
MKIFHVNSYYAAGKFYKNFYNEQIKAGLDINVVVPVDSSSNYSDFDYCEYTDIRKYYKKHDRYVFHIKHNKIVKRIIKEYRTFNYDVIHAHSLFSNGYIAMKLKQHFGVPYIVAVRNTDVNFFFSKMFHLRKLGINIMKEAEQIIFLSPSYRDHTIEKYVPNALKEQITNKVSIIPNGIDNFWFKNIGSPKHKYETTNLKLLQVGDIDNNKNIKTTLKAINILINKGYIVNFSVVGKVKNHKIYKKIKNIDYVNYLGYKSKEELINIYKSNDIFVLPSIYETFGLVYAEAMCQGLPIVYSRTQGFDRQFEDGEVGFAVDCFNADEIAGRIICIINNYQEISKRCIMYSKKFDWNIIVKEYTHIYAKCVRLDAINIQD